MIWPTDLLPARLLCLRCPCVQVGLNGVDNGAIRFTNVRVPRENLLDRFASGEPLLPLWSCLCQAAEQCRAARLQRSLRRGSKAFFGGGGGWLLCNPRPRLPSLRPALSCGTVDRSGRYSSPMTSATKRFAATLGELTGGRVGLTCASGE